jgi:hypothetical protein
MELQGGLTIGWRIQRRARWTGRHGNFILLAIGESGIVVGVSTGKSGASLATDGCGRVGDLGRHRPVVAAFDIVWLSAEHRFVEAQG